VTTTIRLGGLPDWAPCNRACVPIGRRLGLALARSLTMMLTCGAEGKSRKWLELTLGWVRATPQKW
jgi:hypothetical protein